VLRAEPYIKEPFLVHAGDTLILSKGDNHLNSLLGAYYKSKCAATFFVKEIKDPRSFGVIEGEEVESGIYNVERVIEKPQEPPTNLAIVAIYLFTPAIFQALKSINEGWGGELQLTDGIQRLIDSGFKVTAVKLEVDEFWLDVGSPQAYWDALSCSYVFWKNKNTQGDFGVEHS